MPSVTVDVQPAVLDWALQKAQMDVNGSEATNMLTKWRTGEKKPTFCQIEQISKKINIPFGYFFLREPPVEKRDIVDFRTVDSISVLNPSRNLIDTIDSMSRVQEWMAEYNKDNGIGPNTFIGSVTINNNIAQTAEKIRQILEIKTDWFEKYTTAYNAFKYVRDAITNLGILVMMNGTVGNNTHRKLDVEEFRAFTLLDIYAPLIFINTTDTDNGKLFSLLHEFVHVLLGKESFFNDIFGLTKTVSREEQFCNAVAAEILVPDSEFTKEWDKYSGEAIDLIRSLQDHFVSSSFVLLRKALDTGRINNKEYNTLQNVFQKQYKEQKERNKETKSNGGNFYNTLGTKWDHRFIRALYISAESGRTQYSDVYRLTNTTGKTFHELIGKVGGKG